MAYQNTCGAKTRRGTSCQSFTMPNGRCRMHGGTSPGAPKGNRNAWKHGKYSAGSKAIARFIREISGSDHLDSELSDVCAGLRVHLDCLHQVERWAAAA